MVTIIRQSRWIAGGAFAFEAEGSLHSSMPPVVQPRQHPGPSIIDALRAQAAMRRPAQSAAAQS